MMKANYGATNDDDIPDVSSSKNCEASTSVDTAHMEMETVTSDKIKPNLSNCDDSSRTPNASLWKKSIAAALTILLAIFVVYGSKGSSNIRSTKAGILVGHDVPILGDPLQPVVRITIWTGCSQDVQCTSGKCNNGYCKGSYFNRAPTGSSCAILPENRDIISIIKSECIFGTQCESGICKCTDDGGCPHASTCGRDGMCEGRECTYPGPLGQCGYNQKMYGGSHCSPGNKCVDTECSQDGVYGVCRAGKYCKFGSCVDCLSDNHCGETQKCDTSVLGTCVELNCSDPKKQQKTRHKCVRCLEDKHCGSSYQCSFNMCYCLNYKRYNANDGTCQMKKGFKSDCDSDEECTSGCCRYRGTRRKNRNRKCMESYCN